MITFFNASWKLKPGDKVRLTEACGEHPLPPVAAGETGVVVTNGLCDPSFPCLFVKLDNPFEHLDDWGNELEIAGPGAYDEAKPYDPDDDTTHDAWHREMPIEVIA